ncbi:MAG: hypothetical protein M3Q32_13320 [Pseudomonadota bacterium]|nr:hypothetical protein [Pseudomonadota bacterium]
MDELINMVAQRTGLAPEKARTAVDTVVGYLKTKLPGPLAGQIDSALAGGGGGLGDAAKNLGSKFGL